MNEEERTRESITRIIEEHIPEMRVIPQNDLDDFFAWLRAEQDKIKAMMPEEKDEYIFRYKGVELR